MQSFRLVRECGGYSLGFIVELDKLNKGFNMEISKELLSMILGEKAYDIKCVSDNIISFYTDYDQYEEINIYELAHKCKEWAFNNGYELRNGRDIDVKEELCYFCEYKQERQLDYANSDYFLAETEPESIFKACQWILDRKIKG